MKKQVVNVDKKKVTKTRVPNPQKLSAFEQYVEKDVMPTMQSLSNMKVLHQGDFKDFLVAQPNKEIHSVFAKEKEEPNIPGKRGKNPPRKSKFYPINGEESTNVKPLATKEVPQVQKVEIQHKVALLDIGNTSRYFPLPKAMRRKKMFMDTSKSCLEDYTGMFQLTDMAIYALMQADKGANCPAVQEVNFSACINLTDTGLKWFAGMSPNLQKVSLHGCCKVTETGLYVLTKCCKKLNHLNIIGTAALFIPKSVTEIKQLESKNIPMSVVPNFKPSGLDVFKVCVIHGKSSCRSVVKYLSGQQDQSLDPMSCLADFQVNNQFRVNIIECVESLSPMLVTKRALYLLPVGPTKDAAVEAKGVFAVICNVLNKTQNAVFILTSLHDKGETVPLVDIWREIDSLAKKLHEALKTEVQNDLKIAQDDLSFAASVETQMPLGYKASLCEALATLTVKVMDIDTSVPYNAKTELKPLVAGLEKVKELYPEYQEIPEELYSSLTDGSADKLLYSGVCPLEQLSQSNARLMKMQQLMGRAVQLDLVDESSAILCRPDWLATVMTVALTPPPPTEVKVTVVPGLPGNVSAWQLDDLVTQLQGSGLPADQARMGAQIAFKVSASVHPRYAVPYSALPASPPLPVENLFQSLGKADPLFYTVGYQAMISCPVSNGLFAQLLSFACKVRKWSYAWQGGCIIQEGVVETLIEWEVTADLTSIGVYSHSLRCEREYGKVKDIVWHAVLQYRLVLDYILALNQVPYKMSLTFEPDPSDDITSGQKIDVDYVPDTVSKLVADHNFQPLDDSSSCVVTCQLCGVTPSQARLLWKLHADSHFSVDNASNHESVGCMYGVGEDECLFNDIGLSTTELDSFSMIIMEYTTGSNMTPYFHIGLTNSSGTASFNLNTGQLMYKLSSSASEKTMDIDAESIPKEGDLLKLLLVQTPSPDGIEFKLIRNTECIGSLAIPNQSYMPYIISGQGSSMTVTLQPVSVVQTPRDQVKQFTPMLIDKVMEAYGKATSGTKCSRMTYRAQVIEQRAVQKSQNTSALFEFFSSHSRFLCLLPREMSLTTVRYPSLKSIVDFSKQNAHLLCQGIKTDVLHFVDSSGLPLQDADKLLTPQNALYLQNCILGLAMQTHILPSKCSNLISGLTDDKLDAGTQVLRLLFMYLQVLELLVADKTSVVSFSEELLEVVNSLTKDKIFREHFAEGETIRCKGHAKTIRPNKELSEMSVVDFTKIYKFITKLDFQNNKIEKLPDDVFANFEVLESVNFSRNYLSSIPSGLGKLRELNKINFSHNELKDLAPDFVGLKDVIVSLDISHNPFNHLPHSVFMLQSLEELNAENIGTVDLTDIHQLKNLHHLNIGYNHVAQIPDTLGDLPLTFLNLSGVPWIPLSNYPSIVMFTKALSANNVTNKMDKEEMIRLFKGADLDESSDLSREEVATLNQTTLFDMYARLGQKALAYQKSSGFPPMIFHLRGLKTLILQYHGISAVPDQVKDLTQLTELDLSENPQLKTLSAELGALPLKQLQLKNCPAMNTPPKEIVARGFVAVMGYLKRLRLGASHCKRTKLMMVGLGGAGKTSLVQSLINKRYRSFINYDDPITDGIQINTWEVPIEDEDDKLTFSVWDFAGQTVYYNTHQFFLSNRAVYLLLWNVRQGYEHAGLDFWLSSIACHAPKAPIIVVGTHIDKVEKFRLPEDALRGRYPQISSFEYVSSYSGDGVESLRTIILKLTLQQKYMGEKIPEAWLTLEKKLIAHRAEKKQDILPFKTLESLGASCGIFDRTEFIQAIQFLHDLGAVQFFDTDFLRSMVVIYPQWIVDVMACLVTVHDGAVKDGKLMLKDIDKIWSAYPADLHPWLLRLTEEFDLTCPLEEEEASIVPCLLPDKEPKYDWPHPDPQRNRRETMMLYKFQYLPAGLFNRAQVRLHQYSKSSLLWKTGSFLKKNDHIALLLQTDDHEVIVRAQGFRPKNFIFLVHEMIENLIKESYAGVQYDFQIPCKDCLHMNVKEPSMMSYLKVTKALELNVPFIQCDKFFHILSIQQLKDSMPSDKLSNMDSHLLNSVRDLRDLNKKTKISVFFVYSQKNVPDSASADKVVHPTTIYEDMRKQEFLSVSFSDKPENCDMEALTITMKSVDVVVVGISDEFCSNPSSTKLLLYIKDVLQKAVLLVVLGTTKHWLRVKDISSRFGTEVYVDMQNKERYVYKIQELMEGLKKKMSAKGKKSAHSATPQKCFISYCWSNSHDAVLVKKSKQYEGALTDWEKSDPRQVKAFLEQNGVSCWLDIERTGGVGLFHSIADGLVEAEVMVAFVSNQYVESKACVMEFRYALTTRRIPVMLVVVGTGSGWLSSEVGLLGVGYKCKQVNLQVKNEAGYLEILKYVQEALKSSAGSTSQSQTEEVQRNIAFQEVLELTQRKMLRHITSRFISNDLEPYPNLFVVDYISEAEKKEYAAKVREQKEKGQKGITKGNGDCPETEETVDKSLSSADAMQFKYCFRLLCENPRGWHVMPTMIPYNDDTSSEEKKNLIETAAPYLSRVYAIIRHGNVKLECLATPDGELFLQKLEEAGVNSSDFEQEYLALRSVAMGFDKAHSMAHLSRCQVNGKMFWLCEEHKIVTRSKTEARYQGKGIIREEAIPMSDIPETYAYVEQDTPVSQSKESSQKKIFRKHLSKQQAPSLKRQTSQMCSVM